MRPLNLLATAAARSLRLGPAAVAQSAGPPRWKTIGLPGQPAQTGPVASFFVLNADGATLADGKLTVKVVSPNSAVFPGRREGSGTATPVP
jgi:hypothetical protein